MDALPAEIKSRICDYIFLTSDTDLESGRAILKNLRLVCRAWSHAPLPYLTGKFEVSLWGSGIRNLYFISHHPHLAYEVLDLSIRINLNIADPHPAPFARQPKRLSLLPPARKKGIRSFVSSLKSPKSKDGDRRQSSSVSAPITTTYPVNVEQVFSTVEKLSQKTLGDNLGRLKLADGLLDALSTFSAVFGDMLSRLPRLRTLRFNNDSQTQFMKNLKYEEVIRWSPVQDTWTYLSEEINKELFLSLLQFDVKIPSLILDGGSIAWFVAVNSTIAESNNTTVQQNKYDNLISGITSLRVTFDTGAYGKDLETVESQSWGLATMLTSMLPQAHNLTMLDVQKRDSEFKGTISSSMLVELGVISKLPKLKALVLGDISFHSQNLKDLFSSISTTLTSLKLASMTLLDGNWINMFQHLRDELQLREFALISTRYTDSMGYWQIGDRTKNNDNLLTSIEKFVVHDVELLGLLSADKDPAAGQSWKSASDDSIKWYSAGET